MKIINILFYSIFAICTSVAMHPSSQSICTSVAMHPSSQSICTSHSRRSIQVEVIKDERTICKQIIIDNDGVIKHLDCLLSLPRASDNLIPFLGGIFDNPEMNDLFKELASGAYYFDASITYFSALTTMCFGGFYWNQLTQDPNNLRVHIQIGRKNLGQKIIKPFTVPPVNMGARFLLDKSLKVPDPLTWLSRLDTDEFTEWSIGFERGGWSSTSGYFHADRSGPYIPLGLLNNGYSHVSASSAEEDVDYETNMPRPGLSRKKLQNKPIPRGVCLSIESVKTLDQQIGLSTAKSLKELSDKLDVVVANTVNTPDTMKSIDALNLDSRAHYTVTA